MTMRRLGLIALACLLATSAFARVSIKDGDWPDSAPMLALDPDGTGFLLLTDPRRGRNVEATALLRIADQANPGLLKVFGTRLFQEWLTEGRITRRPDGTFDWGSQENFDDLNALLRAAMVMEFRPYMHAIRGQLSAREIDGIAGTGKTNGIQIQAISFGRDWYSRPSDVQPNVCVSVICKPCTGQDPQPQCPTGQCVDDCGGDCSNCEEIMVQPPPEPPPPLECPDGMTPEECWPVEIARKGPPTLR